MTRSLLTPALQRNLRKQRDLRPVTEPTPEADATQPGAPVPTSADAHTVPLAPGYTAVGQPHGERPAVPPLTSEHGPAPGEMHFNTRIVLRVLHDMPELGLRHIARELSRHLAEDVSQSVRARRLAVVREFLADGESDARSAYTPWATAATERDGVPRPSVDQLIYTFDPQHRRWQTVLAAAGGIDDSNVVMSRLGRLGSPLTEPQLDLVLLAFAAETEGELLQSGYELWAEKKVTLDGDPPIRVPRDAGVFGPWLKALKRNDLDHRASVAARIADPDRPRRRAGRDERPPRRPWKPEELEEGVKLVFAEVLARDLPPNQSNYDKVAAELNAADRESDATRYPSVTTVVDRVASPFSKAVRMCDALPADVALRTNCTERVPDKVAELAMIVFKEGGPSLKSTEYRVIYERLLTDAVLDQDLLQLPSEGKLRHYFGKGPDDSLSWPLARKNLLQWAAEHGHEIVEPRVRS